MTLLWKSLAAACAVLALLPVANTTQAEDFPAKGKLITIIVPYTPGGGTDLGARLVAEGLRKELGVPVQVVNKPGAASQVGMQELARAAPDGYTLGASVLPALASHYLDPSRDAPYTRKDFAPVANNFSGQYFLAVRSDSPWQTLKDFVEAARVKPGTIRISDSGLLGTPHLHVLMLEKAAGVKFVSIHFPDGAPSVTALLGGHVDAVTGGANDVMPNKEAGKFRVLGVSAEQPDKLLPDVPTEKSLGYDVITTSYTGLVAPAGTPKPVIDVLTRAVKKIIDDPEYQKKFEEVGLQSSYSDPEAFTAIWVDVERRMKPILDEIKPK
jgi:tripartite-type tricarboxylate transporter receptor subunit TctC